MGEILEKWSCSGRKPGHSFGVSIENATKSLQIDFIAGSESSFPVLYDMSAYHANGTLKIND